MKEKKRQWIRYGVCGVLLACAVGVIAWQGVSYAMDTGNDEVVSRVEVMTSETIEYDGVEETTQVTMQATTITTKATTVTTKKANSSTRKSSSSSNSSKTSASDTGSSVSFPLELNTATVEELTELPGIGDVIAARIVAYRDQIGGFINRDQLLEVEGIGEAKLADIYDLIYLTQEYWYPEEEETTVTDAPVVVQTQPPTAVVAAAEEKDIAEEPTEIEIMDLNEVELEDLMLLPDMTEELATAILDFREYIEYFSDPLELLYVDGMTSNYFLSIQDYIKVDPIETS